MDEASAPLSSEAISEIDSGSAIKQGMADEHFSRQAMWIMSAASKISSQVPRKRTMRSLKP
jgi:hypothetical protein